MTEEIVVKYIVVSGVITVISLCFRLKPQKESVPSERFAAKLNIGEIFHIHAFFDIFHILIPHDVRWYTVTVKINQ